MCKLRRRRFQKNVSSHHFPMKKDYGEAQALWHLVGKKELKDNEGSVRGNGEGDTDELRQHRPALPFHRWLAPLSHGYEGWDNCVRKDECSTSDSETQQSCPEQIINITTLINSEASVFFSWEFLLSLKGNPLWPTCDSCWWFSDLSVKHDLFMNDVCFF